MIRLEQYREKNAEELFTQDLDRDKEKAPLLLSSSITHLFDVKRHYVHYPSSLVPPSIDFPIYEKSPGILTVFLSYLAFFYFIYLAFISILTLSTFLFDNAHAHCIMCYSSSLRSHLHLGTKRMQKERNGRNVRIGTGDRTKTSRYVRSRNGSMRIFIGMR